MTWKHSISLTLITVAFAACTEEVKPRNRDSVAEIEAWSQSFGTRTDNSLSLSKNANPLVTALGPAWDWSDPCIENLHELTGLLLLYLHQHKELPQSLSQLNEKSVAGEERSLHCPASHQDYVYVRDGLVPPLDMVPLPERATGGDKLIIYDASSTHEITQRMTDGTREWDVKKKVRYGIVMRPKSSDGSVMLQVVPVEDALLNAYLQETRIRRSNQQMIQQLPIQPARPNNGGFW